MKYAHCNLFTNSSWCWYCRWLGSAITLKFGVLLLVYYYVFVWTGTRVVAKSPALPFQQREGILIIQYCINTPASTKFVLLPDAELSVLVSCCRCLVSSWEFCKRLANETCYYLKREEGRKDERKNGRWALSSTVGICIICRDGISRRWAMNGGREDESVGNFLTGCG